MPILDQRTVAVIRTLTIFGLLAALFYAARHTVLLVIFAIFFAYLIEPIVARVERWKAVSRGSRGIAIAEVYLLLGGILFGILWQVAPIITSQGRNLLTAAPALLDLSSWRKLIHEVGSNHGWSYRTQVAMEHLVYQHRAEILAALQQVAARVEGIVTNILWVVLIPILAIFLLMNGPDIVNSGIRMLRVRPRAKAFLGATLHEMNDMAAHYVRAQVILAAISLPVYTLVLFASGVQYALILGVLAGIFEFIPMVGPLLGAIVILGTAFLTGFHYVWALVLFLGAWRLMQDYFNSPKLMQHSVKLHPLAVIIAVLAGAEIAGVMGVFLSIPVAATLQIFWRRWRTSPLGMASRSDNPPSIEQRVA